MADAKISQLPSATTPIAGTEVLPIVQSSTTKKIASDDLTVKNVRSNASTGILQIAGPAAAATRIMTVPDANFTVARTDAANSFSNNQTLSNGNLIVGTAGKGVDFTANGGDLLTQYDEGDWTPIDTSGAGLTLSGASGKFTRIGRLVSISGQFTMPSTADTENVSIGGLPFTIGANSTASQLSSYATAGEMALLSSGTTSIYFYGANLTRRTNANYSGVSIYLSGSYVV